MSAEGLIKIDLQGDETVRRVLDELPERGPYAVVRAMNRAATFVRAEAVREIPTQKQLKPSYIRERIEIRQARLDRPDAYIYARTRGTQLSRFPYRQLKAASVRLSDRKRVVRNAGISVGIKTGEAAKVLRSAFLIRLKSGNVGIAVRLEVLRRLGKRWSPSEEGGSGSRRYAVLHTSSVHDVYSDVLPEIATRASPFLQRQLLHELEFELDKLSRE